MLDAFAYERDIYATTNAILARDLHAQLVEKRAKRASGTAVRFINAKPLPNPALSNPKENNSAGDARNLALIHL